MTGLKQRIQAATNAEKIAELLAEGKTYEFASERTKRSWKRAANQGVIVAPAATAQVEEGGEFESAKKSRKKRK